MADILNEGLEQVVSNLIISSVKSLARTNKRAAALLIEVQGFNKRVSEHNNFLDDLIAIIKPALHLAYDLLSKFFPSYMHIIDWVIELCKDIAEPLLGAA